MGAQFNILSYLCTENWIIMSCILHIDTSTEACSVAVSQDGQVIFHKEETDGPSHAQLIGGMVDEALSFTDNHAIPFDAVAISSGPGSYTGLRIGASIAKGVCYARDLHLISIPTLQLMCVQPLLCEELPEDALLCPMIDARRMEVYTALFTRGLQHVTPTEAKVIDSTAFASELDKHPVYFFGNGADKCKDVISHPNAHFIDGIKPLAKWMAPLAEKAHACGEFEDVAYFEPFYLKEFIATKSRNPLLQG